jgi:hypothetical protein
MTIKTRAIKLLNRMVHKRTTLILATEMKLIPLERAVNPMPVQQVKAGMLLAKLIRLNLARGTLRLIRERLVTPAKRATQLTR